MKIVAQFLALLLLVACSTEEEPPKEYLHWEPVQNDKARSFKILRHGRQSVVLVFGPGGRSDTLGIYLIGGDAIADLKPLPELERVIVATTTHLPYLGALGKEGIVVGAAHLSEVFDERFLQRSRNGDLLEVGTADGLDQELVIDLNTQLIFDDPFGKSLSTQNSTRLPVVHITEYLEEHPLGRAEWLKVFGLLLGKETMADSLYKEIKDRYITVAKQAAEFEKRPPVFFGSSWQGQWFAPPANSYMATLIEDAGANYCFNDRYQGNITLDLESVLHKVRRCDHFGMILSNNGGISPIDLAAGEERLVKIPAVQKGGFYGNSSMSDLFGQALLEPDVVLWDLCRIFHPEMGDGSPTRYFHRIELNEELIGDHYFADPR